MKKIVIYIVLLYWVHAQITKPINNSILNHSQILVEWKQMPGVDSYLISVINTIENHQEILSTTENLHYLINLEYKSNHSYQINVCNEDDENNCYISTFSLQPKIDLGQLNVTKYDDYCPEGLTIFGNLSPAFSAAIDCNGNQVWHSSNIDSYVYYNSDKNGRLYGGRFYTDRQPGIDFNVDLSINFEEPNTPVIGANGSYIENFIQHELLKTPNGYLGFSPNEQLLPTPFCDSTPGCTNALSWENNFSDPYAIYRGEKILLWDDSGEVIWSWNAFDHISQFDYDPILNWSAYSMFGYYDWTHFNALDFETENNSLSAIYASSRSLSRIYKIDYPSGNIIWSMGHDWYGNGNVSINLSDINSGWYNGFTFQHGLQILENGNILTLDNGNISAYLPYFLINENYTEAHTRAIEISIDELNNTSEVIWSYTLPVNLFGELSGNVQKLDNGNYLATTVGDFGHTLEINQFGEMLWDLQYKVGETNIGTVYRAHRVASLFPIRYSLISNNMKNDDMLVDENNYLFDFSISNDGENTENFIFDFNNTNSESIEITIYPESRPDLIKQLSYDYQGFDLSNIDKSGEILVPPKSKSIISLSSLYIEGCTNNLACNYDSQSNLDDGTCYYATEIVDCQGNSLNININALPERFLILSAYPNPFNPNISFDIEINTFQNVLMQIHNLKGEVVDYIHKGQLSAGIHSFTWDASDFPSGIYFISMESSHKKNIKKITLLK